MTSPTDLSGRVAIVSGAGRTDGGDSVGYAIAATLAGAGARVTVLDINAAAAAAAVEALGSESAHAVVCDVTSERDCREAVAATAGRWGRVDVLVNSVGAGGAPSIDEISDEQFDRLFALNYRSALYLTRHAARAMTTGGAIVNISSIAVARPTLDPAYCGSKAALEALTRVAAIQYGERGIRVNTVAPGQIWTPMVSRGFEDAELMNEVRSQVRGLTALGTEGTAWDIAEAVVFLTGDAARWITGQLLTVDGGAALVREQFRKRRDPVPQA